MKDLREDQEGPDLSIVVPCYNVAPYIESCLLSIERAHFGKYTHEVICVDDCSDDETGATIDDLAKRFKTIRKVRNKKNLGPSVARNLGIYHSRGRYIWFIDGDDCLVEGADVEKILTVAVSKGVDIVEFRYITVEPDGTTYASFKGTDEIYDRVYKVPDYFKICLEQRILEPIVWNKFFRKNIFINFNLFLNPLAIAGEDQELLARIFNYDNISLLRLYDVLYIYRRRNNSLSTDKSNIEGKLISLRKTITYFKNEYIKFGDKLSYYEYLHLKLLYMSYIYLYTLSYKKCTYKIHKPGLEELYCFIRTRSWKMVAMLPIARFLPSIYRCISDSFTKYKKLNSEKQTHRTFGVRS